MSVRPVTKRGKQWWEVDVRFLAMSGKPAKHRELFRTRRDAAARERLLLLQIANGTFGVKPAQTIADFAPRYMEWSTLKNKPSTVVAKETALRVHILPALGDVRLDASDLRAEVEAFATTKLATLAPKTVKNVLGYLDTLLHLAVDRDLVRYAPKLSKPRVEETEMQYLDLDEAQKVLDAAPAEWRTLLLVALRTGLRAGELLGLRWSAVDWSTRQLRVRVTRWRGLEHSPKGNRDRVVPMTTDVVAALKAHRHLRTYVFDHEDGRPFTHSEWKNVVPRACAAAGVKRVTMHGLRHSFGAALVMRGQPLLVVKEALGHADYKTTLRYSHVGPSAIRDAVESLDGRAM